eukprot:scaffold68994_cov28-Tisochrysis_lutea.AAC.1
MQCESSCRRWGSTPLPVGVECYGWPGAESECFCCEGEELPVVSAIPVTGDTHLVTATALPLSLLPTAGLPPATLEQLPPAGAASPAPPPLDELMAVDMRGGTGSPPALPIFTVEFIARSPPPLTWTLVGPSPATTLPHEVQVRPPASPAPSPTPPSLTPMPSHVASAVFDDPQSPPHSSAPSAPGPPSAPAHPTTPLPPEATQDPLSPAGPLPYEAAPAPLSPAMSSTLFIETGSPLAARKPPMPPTANVPIVSSFGSSNAPEASASTPDDVRSWPAPPSAVPEFPSRPISPPDAVNLTQSSYAGLDSPSSELPPPPPYILPPLPPPQAPSAGLYPSGIGAHEVLVDVPPPPTTPMPLALPNTRTILPPRQPPSAPLPPTSSPFDRLVDLEVNASGPAIGAVDTLPSQGLNPVSTLPSALTHAQNGTGGGSSESVRPAPPLVPAPAPPQSASFASPSDVGGNGSESVVAGAGTATPRAAFTTSASRVLCDRRERVGLRRSHTSPCVFAALAGRR